MFLRKLLVIVVPLVLCGLCVFFLPLLGGFVLFGVAIGGVGCASSIRKHLKV